MHPIGIRNSSVEALPPQNAIVRADGHLVRRRRDRRVVQPGRETCGALGRGRRTSGRPQAGADRGRPVRGGAAGSPGRPAPGRHGRHLDDQCGRRGDHQVRVGQPGAPRRGRDPRVLRQRSTSGKDTPMTSTGNTRRFRPDYAVPPGETLVEVLTERGMSQAELARRTGLFTKHINQIVLGTATLSAETAVKLEFVTGVLAQVWTELEGDYQVARTRREELSRLELHVDWLRAFPVDELIRRGYVRREASEVDRLRDILSFFKVATPEAWQQVWALPTAYRR